MLKIQNCPDTWARKTGGNNIRLIKKLNILMFSGGDDDKALAGLILANSAMDSGLKVNMFFAFWGLLLLRDPEKYTEKDKNTLEKMLGIVTPRGQKNSNSPV